jgi:hypothetical protein
VQAFDLRQSVPTADRYVVPLSRGGGVGSTNVKQCMIFGGTLGGVFPTLQVVFTRETKQIDRILHDHLIILPCLLLIARSLVPQPS